MTCPFCLPCDNDLSIVGQACTAPGTVIPAAGNCLGNQMVQGSPYAFRFNNLGLAGVTPDVSPVFKGLQGDSNFGSPSVIQDSKGLTVNFIYQGQGSTIAAAGGEMEKVINDNSNLVSSRVVFAGGTIGGAAGRSCCSCSLGSSNFKWIAIAIVVGLVGLVLLLHEANS
jgi:hypothetical protein